MHQVDTSLTSYKRPQHARSKMAVAAASNRLRLWVIDQLPLFTLTTIDETGGWTIFFRSNRRPTFRAPRKMKMDVDTVLMPDGIHRNRFIIHDFGNVILSEPKVRDGQIYRINARAGIDIHLVIPQYTAEDVQFNARLTTHNTPTQIESWIGDGSITFYLDEPMTDIFARKIIDDLAKAANFQTIPNRYPHGDTSDDGMDDSSEED